VKYEPGTLLARGYKDGREIATDKVETTGDRRPSSSFRTAAAIKADGEDVSVITVQVNDAQGGWCHRRQRNHVRDSRRRQIIGVGNGDPSSHEPDVFLPKRPVHSTPVTDWKWNRIPNARLTNLAEGRCEFRRLGVGKRRCALGLRPADGGTNAVFRGHVIMPEQDLATENVMLSFGMIDDEGWVYVNGQMAGDRNRLAGEREDAEQSPEQGTSKSKWFFIIRIENKPCPGHAPESHGSAGVPPASREPKIGIRRRDASAPRTGAPVQGRQGTPFPPRAKRGLMAHYFSATSPPGAMERVELQFSPSPGTIHETLLSIRISPGCRADCTITCARPLKTLRFHSATRVVPEHQRYTLVHASGAGSIRDRHRNGVCAGMQEAFDIKTRCRLPAVRFAGHLSVHINPAFIVYHAETQHDVFRSEVLLRHDNVAAKDGVLSLRQRAGVRAHIVFFPRRVVEIHNDLGKVCQARIGNPIPFPVGHRSGMNRPFWEKYIRLVR